MMVDQKEMLVYILHRRLRASLGSRVGSGVSADGSPRICLTVDKADSYFG